MCCCEWRLGWLVLGSTAGCMTWMYYICATPTFVAAWKWLQNIDFILSDLIWCIMMIFELVAKYSIFLLM